MKWKIVQRAAAALAASVSLFGGAPAAAQTQGVSDGEVVLGTYLDFSGPLATWGTALRAGMEMALDEINAAGGVHGRKLRLVVEDSGYDPKNAVLVTQKLLTRDQIFAMVGSLGTVTGAATMPLVLKRGLPHLFPVTPSEMFALPFDRLKFAYFTPYYDDVRTSVKYLLASKRFTRVGVLYQDDEFGADILKATQDQLAEAGLKPVSTMSYKRGATDFSSQIARLKADGAELVVMSTVVRETIGAMAAARTLDWKPTFLTSQAGYSSAVAALGKEVTEGLYAGGMTPIPYAEGASPELLEWIKRYRARANQDPSFEVVVGYMLISTAARGMANAGRELTADSLVAGLEKIRDFKNIFGTPPISFTPTDHLASRQSFVAQIRNGRWVSLTGFMHYKN